jgi:outer membrane putative beta-barrel porin/alpha-amylase
MRTCFAGLLICAFAAGPALGDDFAPAFAPGRPGNTESPISVPTGHWQVETEIGGYAHGAGGQSWSVLQTDIRYGLAEGWDGEAIVAPYLGARSGGVSQSGFGDTTFRLRHTFAGQNGDGPAFAVIGFVTLPSATNHQGDGAFEGGLIATGAFSLTGADAMTYTAGAGARSKEGRYTSELFGGVNLTHQFSGRIAAYGELFADRSQGQTAGSLDIGATYLCDARTQLDAGVDIGLTHAADDAHIFLGWSHLF